MSVVEPAVQSAQTNIKLQHSRTNKVLLLGNDDRVVLAVIRSLGRRGICVDVAWCDSKMPALRSRYLSQFQSLPPYSLHSDDWINALNALVRKQDYDLVIPCNDFAVVPLQLHREQLDKNANWYLINDHAFKVAFDKAQTRDLAQALGIPVPVEYPLSFEQVQELSRRSDISEMDQRQLKFPVFVKPRSSITHDDVKNKRSVQRVGSAVELAELFQRADDADGLLIQENFQGEGIGVEILAKGGRVLMELQHRRLRETIDGGSTYRETIPLKAALSDAAAKLVERLNYTGVAMFEFRFDPRTGQWVLLEINARFWGSLPLAIAAGADFPYCLYEMLVCRRKQFSNDYRLGVRCRNLVADLRAFKKRRTMGDSTNLSLQLMNLLLGKDHLDHFASDDWRPQLNLIWQEVKTLIVNRLKTSRYNSPLC